MANKDNNTIVYTGDFSRDAIRHARTTESILEEEIKKAKKHILILTYVFTSGGQYILKLLEKYTSKNGGVKVWIIYSDKDITNESKMKELSNDFANFKFRKIKNTEGNFHPKCIIFDAKKAYIGSANLTYKAIKGKNIELGVLIHEDAIGSVKTLEKMFKELWGKAEELS